jgi:CRISPR-associated protein Cmr1
MDDLKITLKTLTPLWTGGVEGTCDRLHETGLIGSLRWWYEALVRGLGGQACDPTEHSCTFDEEKYRKSKADDEHQRLRDAGVCNACQLFGCTGWARKFRLCVLDEQGRLVQDALAKNQTIQLQFLELRPMSNEERWLLTKAVEIASNYGALGGKTTLKPQKGKVGEDYGIVQTISVPSLLKPDVEAFLRKFRQVKPGDAADLRWFFFAKGAFLWRRQMNALLGLSENGQSVIGNEPYQQFLRGRRGDRTHEAISKKLFSFQVDGGRIWGYARDGEMRDTIIEQIHQQLKDRNYVVKTGEEVLHEL